ncbi:MAG: cyclic nucleotide-binding domain-containing protein [Myxococcales bacterium]|nr:MAG: cyclic nucleotide-binding domain-containing protein [Myxococcales bacterium]
MLLRMVQVPPLQGAVEERAIDRALSLALGDDSEGALRIAAALLEAEPLSAFDTFVTAWLLGKQGRKDELELGLRAALDRAVFDGNLPLAIAAQSLLREAELPVEAELEAMASAFAKGSARLSEKRVAPPQLAAAPAKEPPPLDEELEGEALLDRASEILKAATAAQDEASLSSAAGQVPPQVLFSALDAPSFQATVAAFEVRFVPDEHALVEEGTVGNEAFILARGELDVSKKSMKPGGAPLALARLGKGALFGEMALLSSAPRTATVTACRPSVVLAGSKAALDRVAAQAPEVGRVFAEFCRRRMLDNLMRTNFILRSASPSERPALIERFTVRQFAQGERIIAQGSPPDGLHIVALGEVNVLHHDGEEPTLVAKLGPGEVVGEVALILRRPAITDVVAHHPTVTLFLQRDRFLGLARAHPKIFVELYELAVHRDQETAIAASSEAAETEDFVLV